MKLVGIDVGSTTVKAAILEADGDKQVLWQDYQRHNTRQAEKVLEFLGRMEDEAGLTPGRDRVFFTGSGAGLLGPLVGAKMIQEVVAVAACVEKLHPAVRFVSEIGGEDMKTIFFTPSGTGRSKQVYMQSACSGGTGTFIEKTARKLQVPSERLAAMPYAGMSLHKVSSKCGIFAETDANSLVKTGVPVEEIIASLFEAVVYQNLATLTKGNTPSPEVLLLGGPNLFFTGLQEAWRHHLGKLWEQRKIALPDGRDAASFINVPADALYYACLGCVEIGAGEAPGVAVYQGRDRLRWWVEEGQQEQKAKDGARALVTGAADLQAFVSEYDRGRAAVTACEEAATQTVLVGCDFGSTTAKAVVLSPEREMLFSCYALSKGNPIEDAQSLFRQVREAGFTDVGGLALTGYGKDLLKDVLGADVAVVETVAHATGTLHFYPDADVICDVGGTDVKIMILRQGTVADFRLNSQCSSGNGAFLQGVAERYNIPLEEYAGRAFEAKSMPTLAMGCGVFLQSDIVNQQRKGWAAEEIMAALAAVLPVNVWIYAGQLQNLRAVGRKFVLQGGTHRNMAVVKAQVDFIRDKVPDAEVVLHPFSGEAGAIGAALCAADARKAGVPSRFRGFDVIESLTYTSTTAAETVCKWCPINCTRTFIDVKLPDAAGRPWSKLPLAAGWERVISGNSCPKGLVEDVNEMRQVKAKLEEVKRGYPNVAEMVRTDAFRRSRSESGAVAH
ncbi:MAG TPA: BadF/BadG/BcrA/BcrD ATPase family protein [Candidatus Limnocylindrales bacterium]|nr:BadF/BadG/BcrA/BcrD ATPase family protein [Candidatus Limnocylindrales bacterium]